MLSRYTKDSIEQISVSVLAMITKDIEGKFISRVDKFHSRTIENTVGVLYRSQCWAVGLDYTRSETLDNRTDNRIIVKLSLSGLVDPNF
jgi:lipopolysaccharide assembly outer membrane protein LptD (OstA)